MGVNRIFFAGIRTVFSVSRAVGAPAFIKSISLAEWVATTRLSETERLSRMIADAANAPGLCLYKSGQLQHAPGPDC